MIKQLALLLLAALCCNGTGAQVALQNLRCEMRQDPEGIDIVQPRLSWQLRSTRHQVVQTAYQVLVASSVEKLAAGEGDLWNPGKQYSDSSINITYQGHKLNSRTACFWKVRVWTNKGETEWSAPARWSMGLLYYQDWKGRWIGLERAFPWDDVSTFARLSARYFRKEFAAAKPVRKATAYIIGLGLYELYVNGSKAGDAVLAPSPTDYTKGVKYNVLDVTSQLQQGSNAIGVILGNGRYYTMRQGYKAYKIKDFGKPRLLMQLEIVYADGEKQTITTDDTWKVTSDGPIRTNNEYDGEEYDATRELGNWSQPGYQDGQWLKAELVQDPGGTYEAQLNPNMRVMDTIHPVAITRLDARRYVLDMGQNMAGWLRFTGRGKKGDTLTLRFAETLQASGELYRENLRDARVTDKYIFKGSGTETWQPRFVYHGFRYVEVTGFNGVPERQDFEGQVVYDEMPVAGSFETSDSIINGVYRNAYWGIRSNYKGMPVDCPQRNERQPWLGDRSVGSYGESFIFNNQLLYAKWLNDIAQAQKADGSIPDVAPAFWRYYSDNVTWPGTYLMVVDMLYRQYADALSVKKHYPNMRKWMLYMQQRYMQDYLLIKDKYGDWCVPPEKPSFIHARDPARLTDGMLLATATYYHLLGLMQRFAVVAGQPDDVNEYRKLAEKVKTAFNKTYFNRKNYQYSNNTITANLLPLYYNLADTRWREKVFGNIITKTVVEESAHIGTGVIGTQYLMRGLTENGRPDVAYQLATATTYPSWGYMLKNGATTIWELWNGNTADPGMNSGNHVMLLGDLIIWYYESLAGIRSDAAATGFRKIIMKPAFVKPLHFVKSTYESPYGTIGSHWQQSDSSFRWAVTVPANTKALVYLPAKDRNAVQIGGRVADKTEGVQYLRAEADQSVFEVGSGEYVFDIKR